MQASPASSTPALPGGRTNVSLILSAVAVVLAAAALVVAFAVPGPAGPGGATGATGGMGPRGPAGNGTIQGSFYDYNETALVMTNCTTDAGANVTLTLPARGTVVLTAFENFIVGHTTGTYDAIDLAGGTPANYCMFFRGNVYVPASQPTGSYVLAGTLIVSLPILSAGTYTFSVSAVNYGGLAVFEYVSMSAVFYPA